jgi:aminocarboxymuconate-semialdehyde decarboxylase
MQDPALAAAELERATALPGMRGVQLAASVGGAYLGDERFEPFWEAAERLGAVVLVHPTTRGFHLPVLEEHYLWNTVGNPLETAVTAAHMTMTGLLERRPALRIVLAHGGGAFLALRGRLRHSHTFQPEARSKLEASPLDSIRRFHYDTVMHDVGLLRDLVDVVGADHVLLGSDYPFDMGTTRPVEEVRELGLAPVDEALVLGGNASRLLELSHER